MPYENHSARPVGKSIRRLSTFAAGGLLLTGAATAAAAASHAATPSATTPPATTPAAATPARPAVTATSNAASRNPRGTLVLRVAGRHVFVSGVAVDPDTKGAVRVAVSIDGKPRAVVASNRAGHVYAGGFTLGYGRYTISAQAFNRGPGTANPLIGRRVATIYNPATRNPVGSAAFGRTGSALHFAGRASDPDAPNSSLLIRVYDNGHVIAAARTNGRTHAYSLRTSSHYGLNHLSVVAFNVGLGTRNPHIGGFTVNRPLPWVDSYRGAQHIAATMVAAHGWNASQMADLVKLWNKESGWRVSAANPSGAYGIPQALPGNKMAAFGPNWRSDASTQIAWGLNYIAGRYGSPSAAWAHSVATNWY